MTRRPTTTAKTQRKKLTPKEKLEVLDRCGVKFTCPGVPKLKWECGNSFGILKAEYDHIGELALTNDNSLENFQPICPVCHGIKTNGRKATSIGSSKFEVAKTKRLEGDRLGTRKEKPKKPIPSRPLSNSKYKKKLDGTVEERK